MPDEVSAIAIGTESDLPDSEAPPAFAVLRAQSDDIRGFENFPSGCGFAPDGSCVLTYTVGDSKLRLYNSSNHESMGDASEAGQPFSSSTAAESKARGSWAAALTVPGGNAVRSFHWYPHMQSTDPATCCFIATARNQPVHLYDAYTGAVRASYRPYNALDELESPVVASFDHSGTKIAAGGYRTDRTLHLFDVAVPGRESTVLRLGKTRRSSDGQKGMVSSMTFSMDDKCLALGTYAPGSIYVYDCRQERPSGSVLSNSGICVVGHGRNHGRKKRRFSAVENRNQHETGGDMEVSGGGDEEESWLNSAKSNWYHSRVQGGVTQLLFSPREYFLFSTSRRSDAVLMWDLRMMSDDPEHLTHPVAGLASYATKNDTNQRLQFELDDAGESLYAGGVDGRIRTYSTITGELIGIIEDRDGHPANGVSFTCAGSSRLLAVTTGARKFPTEKELELDRLPLYCDDYGVGSSPGSLSLYKLQKGSLP